MTTPNLPAFLQNAQPSRLSDTLGSNLGGGAPPYLSIQGNRLTLVDASGDSEPVTTVDPKTGIAYLDCVIIDAGDHASKIYYSKDFDPNASSFSPPDCWSDNGIAPSVNCSLPQARSCTPDPAHVTGCKWAVWGSKTSKVTGKGVPACGKYQKLALLIPGDDVLFLLRVPPNSLDNLRSYNAKFKGQQVGIESVITRISFEGTGVGTLTFNAVNYIDEAAFKQRQAAIAAKVTDNLVGRSDQPIAGVAAPAQVAPPQQHPQASLPAPTVAAPPAQPAPFAQPTGAQPAPASPSEAQQPARRRRRTQAEMQAAQAVPGAQQAPAASPGPAAAPFRPTEPPQTAPQAPGASFGIQGGVAPDPALQSAINSIFGS